MRDAGNDRVDASSTNVAPGEEVHQVVVPDGNNTTNRFNKERQRASEGRTGVTQWMEDDSGAPRGMISEVQSTHDDIVCPGLSVARHGDRSVSR